MLSSLKVAKKYMPVYCFHRKHFTCCDLRGMLEAVLSLCTQCTHSTPFMVKFRSPLRMRKSVSVLESRRVFAALRLGFTQHTDTYNTISEDL